MIEKKVFGELKPIYFVYMQRHGEKKYKSDQRPEGRDVKTYLGVLAIKELNKIPQNRLMNYRTPKNHIETEEEDRMFSQLIFRGNL